MSDWHNEFRKALYWGAWRVKPDLSTEEKAEAFEVVMPLMLRATRAAGAANGPVPWGVATLRMVQDVFVRYCEFTPEVYEELREQGHDV